MTSIRSLRRRAMAWTPGVFAVLMSCLSGGRPASGQSAPAATHVAVDTLQEITVTAQRRPELLDRVPIAITAVSGESLDKSNITDLTGLNGIVPGLAVERSSGSELMISIRGIGSETPQSLYTQPGVSVFVDGIYIPTALGVYQGFFDTDRVEVLRGPQGTLFGQSSTGGTINIVTHQPVLGRFEGDVEASYGNHDLNRERADINLPLAATLALRVAFQHYQHDGFGTNLSLPHAGLDDANDDNVKLSLLWQPAANVTSTTTARLYREARNGAEQKNVLDPNPDPRQVEQDTPASLDMHYQIYGEALAWTLPWFTVKSTTGYQKMKNDQAIDDDRLTAAILGYYNAQPLWASRLDAFSEEINLLSRSGGVLDWTAGFYYIWQKTGQYIVEYEASGPAPTRLAIPPLSGPLPADASFIENSSIKRNSYAPFFQATYHLTDRLRFTGGARYNHDGYDGSASFYYASLSRVPDYSSHTVTGKAEVDFDLADGNLLYASWTRGYKPGGINNTHDDSAVLVTQFFRPEIATSFEVGSKNRFIDDHLSIDAAGFFSHYQDMQFLASDPVPFQDGIANIPDVHIWGAELESAIVALNGHFHVNANLTGLGGRVHGDYVTIDAQSAAAARNAYQAANPGAGQFDPATIAAVTAAARDTRNNTPPKLPKWAGSLDVAYGFDFAGQSLTPRLEYVYRGAFEYRVFNESALDTVASYGIFNAYLEYRPPLRGMRLALAATNLTDKAGIAGRFTDPFGSGQTSNEYIPPRQVVFTVSQHF
jgi:iron complex outermembrane receptor protein